MHIGDRVRQRMEVLGIATQNELVEAVKHAGGSLSQSQVSGLFGGTVKRPRSLPELARALHTTVIWLLQDESGATPPPESDAPIPPPSLVRPVATAPSPLVVYRTRSAVGRAGEYLIYREKAGLATRPAELEFSADAFASEVQDDDAEPRYRRRDTLLVDPSSPPAPGDDCFFIRDPDSNPFETIVRRLVRITEDHWIVKRFELDAREQKLARSEWRAAWRIFGAYNRR